MTAQTPFIDPATIDDLSAALADARRAADGALARDAALALEAAFAANAGRLGAARERTAQAVRNAADPRILFFGFQSFFRSAVAPGVPEDRKAADLATAESLCRRRLDAAQASGDRAVECRAHTNLALVLHYRQRPDAAATHYRGSVELARILGDPRSLARSLGNYANFLETGRPPVTRDELLAAAGLYAGAIAAARAAADAALEAGLLSNLGDTRAALGEAEPACALWRQALRLIGDAPHKARDHLIAMTSR